MKEKIARICWNENKWKNPSGKSGKSENKELFEAQNGFGFEEWIFDFDTLIDGYKYAFLQPINTKNHAHSGQEYAIHLYAYDKWKSQSVSIAKVSKVQCLTESEANSVYEKLRSNSTLEQMISDVQSVGADANLLQTLPAINCFNIRFRPRDVKFVSNEKFASLHELTRYNLYDNKHYLKGLYVGFDSEDQFVDDISDILQSDISDTEKDTRIKARVGQGKFRRNVINVWGKEVCAVTLNPTREVLVASHIKAWKDCDTAEERLDGANGVLLEATLDRLFDIHLMTFLNKRKNEYEIKYSNKVTGNLPKHYKDLSGYPISTRHLSDSDATRFARYIKHHNDLFLSKNEE